MTPRDLALSVLNRLDRSGAGFPVELLNRAFRKERHLDQRDRAFTVQLVQGVLRWRLRLDRIIRLRTRFPFSRIDPPVLNILRLALYQILFLDRVPDSAAVNEAVKQAKRTASPRVSAFVNAMLRRTCRGEKEPPFPDRAKDPVEYLSVYYSYPRWMVEKWIGEMGDETTEALLKAGNRTPRLVIRCNSLKTDRSVLAARLAEEGIRTDATPFSPEGLTIKGGIGSVSTLRAFRDGLFQIQSEAAQICSYLLSPRPGDHVLDLCAGLGGKSTHMAQMMGDRGSLVALDMSRRRLIKLKESSRRLGIACIHPVSADAADRLSSLFRYPFAKILVDGPCSALGVISGRPDVKWARTPSDPARLARIQRRILEQAGSLLAKDGELLYVTCTVSKQENEGVVNGFLASNPGIFLQNLKDRAPRWAAPLVDDRGFFRVWPHLHGMDGFFGALFRKGSGGTGRAFSERLSRESA
ncbi:MAG: 16S rRNA (cytosine(967)-C(5))-methyltransferase RsmB [Deltaproteobacteria bacterium]|nr:MAG: 16S rRNA (cytosine(967)-C(5))-methyltransferase RsmB [Deltaproteobacteria bacterium]